MDAGFRIVERFLDGGDRREQLVLHLYQVHGLGGHILVYRRDSSHRVAHHADFFERQGVLILADGQNPVGDGQIFSGQDGLDAAKFLRFGGVDADDAGVRHAAA